MLHVVVGEEEVEEEVEAVGDDEGACSTASLEDAVEGSGGAISFVIMAFFEPGDSVGAGVGVGVGVGVDVGVIAEEDL